jgi:hypothetical protein
MQKKEDLNRGAQNERELVAACLAALKLDGGPLITRWTDEPTLYQAPQGIGGIKRQLCPDGIARIEFRGEELDYAVEIKRLIGKNNIGAILNIGKLMKKQEMRLLLCAPYIHPLIARFLREAEIDYVDETGNALIRGNTTYIQIGGNKPKQKTNFTRALTATDTKLLGAYLANVETEKMLIKDLATTAGIAIGAVGKAKMKLKAHGLLANHGKRDWRIQNRAKALTTFAEHWGTRLRPKLAPTTYMPINTDEHGPLEQRIAALGFGKHTTNLEYLIGGEYAAALITQFISTDFATLHVQEDQTRLLAKQMGLVPAPDGPVTILERFGTYDRPASGNVAHPLLVWAECLFAQNERVAQAAEIIYQRHLIEPHE